jgi:hypothetical protein
MHRIPRVRSCPGRFAACVLAAALAGPVLRAAGADDRPPVSPPRPPAVNLLANARLDSAVAGEDLAVPQWLSILDASFTSPIVLRTSIPHGLSDGDAVVVRGVLGNEAANGFWRARVVSPTEIALEGSVGSGNWAGGGAFYPAAGQPRPPGPQDHAGNLLWTPWFSFPASVTAREFFSAARTQPTGEVSTLPPSPGDAFLSQEVDGSLFSPGESLSLSIECRMPQRPVGNQSLKLLVTALLGAQRTYQARFAATQVTSSYQRFSMAFTLDNSPIPPGSLLRVEFVHEVSSGAPAAMFWTRPMLSAGAQPPPWTGEVPSLPRSHSFYPASSSGRP